MHLCLGNHQKAGLLCIHRVPLDFMITRCIFVPIIRMTSIIEPLLGVPTACSYMAYCACELLDCVSKVHQPGLQL